MSDNITKRSTLKNKKRYVAIAALAGLVATGGVIGATVTSESTIADNQITITEKLTGANVAASGAPIALSLERGVRPDGEITMPGNSNLEAVSFPVGSWTLTNSGETDATVKLLPLELVLPVDADINELVPANIRFMSGSKTVLSQQIGAHNHKVTSDTSITVPAGETITIDATALLGTQFIDKMKQYNKTFDLQFDYVDKNTK